MDVTTTTYESVASFTCGAGFVLTGAASITCQADGTWSDLAPECLADNATCADAPCLNGGACNDATCSSVATDLLISEYIEGSSNNKGIELFNGTESVIVLEAYGIKIGSNGADLGNAIELAGEIAPNETYLVCNSSASFAAQCDQTTGSISFNGNDAVALVRDDNVIDTIGVVGESQYWGIGDTSDALKDHTIVRNNTVLSPSETWNPDEWTVLEQDEFDEFGSHSLECEASGYTCDCADTGFEGGNCEIDIDECLVETDNCSENADCSNTTGGFECTCNAGYSGDGVTCEDIDECVDGANNCSVNATCTNNEGGFDCACNPYFTGDGLVCDDIDECIPDTDGNNGCGVRCFL